MITKYYEKVVTGNKYELTKATKHTLRLLSFGVRAREMPALEEKFVTENHIGCCLHYAMFLIALLHEAGIKCYFTTTPEEDGANHCSVLYFENGNKYIADPVMDIKNGTSNEHMRIDYDEFVSKSIRNEIAHYDLFGEDGKKPFFEPYFLRDCKISVN